MPRLFLGIKPPAHARRAIESEIYPVLRKKGNGFGISNPEDWHITTHFIGNVTTNAARKIMKTFHEAPLPSLDFSAPISLGGEKPVDAFGKNTLFLEVNDLNGDLHRLHEWGKELVPVALTRPQYRPHLTLARNPAAHPFSPILTALNQSPFTTTFQLEEITLFDSVQREGQTSYVSMGVRRFLRGKNP